MIKIIKLTDKARTIIALVMACLLILMGLIQAVFKVEFPEKITNEASFIIMMIAAVMIFGRKRNKRKGQEDEEVVEENEDDENIKMIEEEDKDKEE